MKISNFRSQISNVADQRGAALILVLWIFIFLFVVAFDFSSSVREEGMTSLRYAEETEGYYLALAGFADGLKRLLDRPVVSGSIPGTHLADEVDGNWKEASLGEGFYRLRFIDEAGKVNINRASEEMLRLIFGNLGIEEPLRGILVDSILDWRDEDDLHRLNGAEKDYYGTLSPSYSPRNGAFDTVEDLLWVRGMTDELFYGSEGIAALRDIFTVDSPMDRVNLRTAPAEVIHAVTGLSLEKSREFVEERERLSEKTLLDLLKLLGVGSGEIVSQHFVFVMPSTVSIDASGYRSEAAAPRRVRAVVRIAPGQRGFELTRWVDRM